MSSPLGSLTRTHTCGALRTADVGADAVLLGWIHRVRDLGGLLFIDVRDRHGVTQVMVPSDSPVMADAKKLRSEYVVAVLGPVRRRDPETVNTKLETGEVEVVAREIRLLNDARTPPIPIADDTPVSEDVRLRYRYLDLRRPRLQVQPRPPPSRDDGDPEVFRRQRLLGDRDADSRRSRRPKARATTWCRAACIRASSLRCRSRRSSSSRS